MCVCVCVGGGGGGGGREVRKEEDWIKICKCEYMNVLTWNRGYTECVCTICNMYISRIV